MKSEAEIEIERTNADRAEAMRHLESSRLIFEATGCSLGSDIVAECIQELRNTGCDEY